MSRFFTLIEMVIVFALLAVVATAAGVSFVRMKEQELFFEGVRQIQNELMLAEEMMQLQNSRVSLTFEVKEGALHLLISEKKKREESIRGITQFTLKLKGVDKETLIFSPVQEEPPIGLLTLSNGKEERGFLFNGTVEFPTVYIPPYPMIERSSCDAEYPTELLQNL